jgi:hypothetical protein
LEAPLMLVNKDRTAAAIAATFLCLLLRWDQLNRLLIFLNAGIKNK